MNAKLPSFKYLNQKIIWDFSQVSNGIIMWDFS